MGRASRTGTLRVGNIEVPVHFFFENRTSSRVSLGKEAVLVRLPFFKRGPLLKKEVQWIQEWLHATYKKKPAHFHRIARLHQPHTDGEILTLFDMPIQLRISYKDKLDKMIAKWSGDDLDLKLPTGTTRNDSNKVISRALATRYRPHFEEKVAGINKETFRQTYNSVRLKYNTSNWGSCSTNGNINLSTRLILTPEDVQDYIVVHELAHLIEMNHSSRFWSLVEEAMPDYQEKEKWLRDHGALMDF
jgi:predicted metal-dependent hydrolase